MQIVSLQALVLTYNARATLPSAEAVAATAALEEFDFVPCMTSEGYTFGRSDADSIETIGEECLAYAYPPCRGFTPDKWMKHHVGRDDFKYIHSGSN